MHFKPQQEGEITLLNHPRQQVSSEWPTRQLILRWRDQKIALDENGSCISLGRDADTDLTVASEYASRRHARIEIHRNNFLFIDDSSNGTYVRINEDQEFFLHHQETVLRDKGVISLGRTSCSKGTKLIFFSVTA